VDDLDDAADLAGGKMGIDATRKWASEEYTPWPAPPSMPPTGRKAAEVWDS
jgi:3-polyprenyl-4-hydroxybenzoate decarboxylase